MSNKVKLSDVTDKIKESAGDLKWSGLSSAIKCLIGFFLVVYFILAITDCRRRSSAGHGVSHEIVSQEQHVTVTDHSVKIVSEAVEPEVTELKSKKLEEKHVAIVQEKDESAKTEVIDTPTDVVAIPVAAQPVEKVAPIQEEQKESILDETQLAALKEDVGQVTTLLHNWSGALASTKLQEDVLAKENRRLTALLGATLAASEQVEQSNELLLAAKGRISALERDLANTRTLLNGKTMETEVLEKRIKDLQVTQGVLTETRKMLQSEHYNRVMAEKKANLVQSTAMQLKEQFAGNKGEMKALAIQLTSNNEDILELQSAFSDAEKEVVGLKAEKEQLTGEIKILTEQVAALGIALQDKAKSIESSSKEFALLQESKLQLEKRLQASFNGIKEAKADLDGKIKELKTANITIKDLEGKIASGVGTKVQLNKLMQDKKKLEAKNVKLQAQVAEIEKLTETASQSQALIQTTQSELKIDQAKIVELEGKLAEIKALKAAAAKSQEIIQAKQTDLDAANVKITEYEKKLAEIAKLQETASQSQALIQTTQDELKADQTKIVELEGKLAELEALKLAAAKSQEIIQAKQADLDAANVKITEYEKKLAEIAKLQETASQSQALIQTTQDELKADQAKIAELEGKLAELEALKSEADKSSETIKTQQADLEAAKVKIGEYEQKFAEIEKLKSAVAQSQTLLKTTQGELKADQDKIVELEGMLVEFEALKASSAKSEEMIQAKQAEVDAAQTKIVEYEKKLAEIAKLQESASQSQALIQTTQDELKASQDKIAEFEGQLGELEALKAAASKSQKMIQAKQAEVDAAKAKMAEYDKKLAAIKELEIAATKSNEIVKAKQAELAAAQATIAELEKQAGKTTGFEKAAADATLAKNEALDKVKGLEVELAKIKAALPDAQGRITALEKEVAGAKGAVQKKQDELTAALAALKAAEKAKVELDDLKNSLQGRDEQLSSMKQMFAAAQATSSKSQSALDAAKQQVAQLLSNSKNTTGKLGSLTGQVQQLKDELKKKEDVLTQTSQEIEKLKAAQAQAAEAGAKKLGDVETELNAKVESLLQSETKIKDLAKTNEQDKLIIKELKTQLEQLKAQQQKAAKQVTATPDSDKDGVADSMDLCPNTPAGQEVDNLGCQPDAAIVLEGINFAFGTATLTGEASANLDNVVNVLRRFPELDLEVSGHTDSKGDENANRTLSAARALAVKNYLVRNGVVGDRLDAKGYGSQHPIATNDTADGRRQNRRVELRKK